MLTSGSEQTFCDTCELLLSAFMKVEVFVHDSLKSGINIHILSFSDFNCSDISTAAQLLEGVHMKAVLPLAIFMFPGVSPFIRCGV